MTQRPGPDIYTVTRLNREVRALLQTGLPSLWIEGEVSRVARPASGHLYFELKDPTARVRCVLWRARAALYGSLIAEGSQVLLRVRATLYEDRGEYQLDVEHAEAAGEGRLRLAFEALKRRLAAEGLFDAERRRPLPALPRRIGVITSPTGAALHDVLSTLARRAPWLSVIIYPTSVQGAGAAVEIAAALGRADRRAECDALLLVRGGGSLEDLWSFNEEVVARAIRACRIPVVAGVGHEVDVTIADLAADLRAPTPTAAAEVVAPDGAALAERSRDLGRRLAAAADRATRRQREGLAALGRRLRVADPRARLRQRSQRIDELEARLARMALAAVSRSRRAQADLGRRLGLLAPGPRLQRAADALRVARRRLAQATAGCLARPTARLEAAARTLHALSPLATLTRGYAIVTDHDGRLVTDARRVPLGAGLEARLATGRLRVTVTGQEEG